MILQQQPSFVVPLLLLVKGNKDKKPARRNSTIFHVCICMCECGHGAELYFTVVVVVPSHAAEKVQTGAHTPGGRRRHSYFFFGAMKE